MLSSEIRRIHDCHCDRTSTGRNFREFLQYSQKLMTCVCTMSYELSKKPFSTRKKNPVYIDIQVSGEALATVYSLRKEQVLHDGRHHTVVEVQKLFK